MDRRIFITIASAGCALAVWPALQAAAQNRPIYTPLLSSTAIEGHDAVAYFTQGRAVKGDAAYSVTWRDVTWRFASQANLDAFKASPEKYAPQYGGHCSWAAARGYKAKGDPLQWRIVDGRLFLNYDERVHKEWQTDIPGNIKSADAKWPAEVK